MRDICRESVTQRIGLEDQESGKAAALQRVVRSHPKGSSGTVQQGKPASL